MAALGLSFFSKRNPRSQFVWLICFCIFMVIFLRYQLDFFTRNQTNNTMVGSDNNSSQQLAKIVEFWDGKPFAGADNYIKYSTQRFHLNSSLKQNYEPLLIDIPAYRYPITVQKCMDKQDIFVAVISAADNFEKRETIRRTWLRRLNSSDTGFAFVVALPENATIQRGIEQESKEHGDIIQINFKDRYHNMTLKAIGLLNWVNINCPRILYLLKCDDDVYVNLPNFYAFLGNVSSQELAIYGAYLDSPPQRFAEGKWFLSAEEWPWSHFPAYFSGPSILITGKSISPLLDVAKVTPYFWIDDVYVTGILTEKAGVTLHGSPNNFLTSNNHCLNLIRKSISWVITSSDEMYSSHKITGDVNYINNNC